MTRSQKNALTRTLCTLLSLILLMLVLVPCAAIDRETITVRVGFFAFDGYHEQSENGIRSGYGYEILGHMAGYAGLRYEYIGYDKSWGEMQRMLENGEIDLLTSAQRTPEREELFDFSKTNIGVSSAILTCRIGSDTYTADDYSNWNGIRVGMLNESSRNDSFADFAALHGFTYTPAYFESTDELVDALKSDTPGHQIDAILSSNLRHIEGERILAQFDYSPFYIMVQKGNTALLDRINYAIDQLDKNEPGLRTRLLNKYYESQDQSVIAFTPEERAYIDAMQGKPLTALINPDRAPYSYYENGEGKGILFDAAQLILERSGLTVSFLPIENQAAYQAAVKQGKADLHFDAISQYALAEADGYWLTDSCATFPLARLSRRKTTAFKTAAIPVGHDLTGSYADLLKASRLRLTYYDSVDEAISAVQKGKQDVAFLALDTAMLAVRNDPTNRLVAEEIYGSEITFAIAVNQNSNPLLFSIMNKAAASLTPGEINTIQLKYTENLEKPFSLTGYFYEYPIRAMLVVVVIICVLIMIGVLIVIARRRKLDRKYLEKEQAQNELLRNALDAAEQAGAAKSQFLSRVSHEMRTPLNAVIGFIELARGADTEQMENYRVSTDIAARQLLNVINDVLDMSSIESGKLKIANNPFNFKHLLSSITNLFGTQCRQKGISFDSRIATPINDRLIGDELRLNQILMNLLGNAVKFTSEGYIRLTVKQMDTSENQVFLRFEITDSGCGMSDELMARLFRPFEQENAATASKYGGSGLGLSIVKNLTSLMNGSVNVISKQGEGTTFTVDLPFGIDDTEEQQLLLKHSSSLRVLCVDDEVSERAYLEQVLSRMQLRFTCVASGSEALQMIEQAAKEQDPYNVCLVDWRMPDMNGFETTKAIREKYGSDVVVIIVSAYDFEHAGEQATAAGANMFLSKPVFQSSLFDLLMTMTNGSLAKPEERVPQWDFTGKRILLAEDNLLNQIVAKGYLQKYNVLIDTAANGQEAVSLFETAAAGTYDAILMDIQMPTMDGFAATKAIRQSAHPDAKTIPIIAQTADAFNEDIAKAFAAGMNGHVAKPIEPQILAKALRDAFSGSHPCIPPQTTAPESHAGK